MSRPLTQSTLDRMQCDDPTCEADHGALYVVPKCHPESGVEVSYCKVHGTLNIACKTCDDFIVSIAVATGHGGSLSCRH